MIQPSPCRGLTLEKLSRIEEQCSTTGSRKYSFSSIRLPWMVNSIPSPIATSSWFISLALFLSLYASSSPSARSRSPSRSIPSAQSYKISNPPLSESFRQKIFICIGQSNWRDFHRVTNSWTMKSSIFYCRSENI